MTVKELFKTVYDVIPLKKELYSFIKFFYSPPESIYKHLYFNGRFTVQVQPDKKFKVYHRGYMVENEIFWKGLEGGWEKKSIELWIKLCRDADIIFDIGANTGIYGLIAKAVNKHSKVFCFEPIPKVFGLLKENVALNNYDIDCREVALSDYIGNAKIYMAQNLDFEYSVTVNKNRTTDANAKEMDIKVDALQSFIETNHIPHIDLMKIDVETHEVEVLKGMGTYLAKFKPTMIIEVLEEGIAEKLNKLLYGMGYLYFNIDDAKGTIRQLDKLAKSDYYNFLVCSPEVAQKLALI
jgi:FkbM family methyltransferase